MYVGMYYHPILWDDMYVVTQNTYVHTLYIVIVMRIQSRIISLVLHVHTYIGMYCHPILWDGTYVAHTSVGQYTDFFSTS